MKRDVAEHQQHVAEHLGEGPPGVRHVLDRLSEEDHRAEQHEQRGDRRHDEHPGHAVIGPDLRCQDRADGPAEVDQRVVDGEPERPDIGVRRTFHGADDAGLDQRSAASGQDQDQRHERGLADRIRGRLARGHAGVTDQKVADRIEEERSGERAPEAKAIDEHASDDRQRPREPGEHADEPADRRQIEADLVRQVEAEDCFRCVEGEPFE